MLNNSKKKINDHTSNQPVNKKTSISSDSHIDMPPLNTIIQPNQTIVSGDETKMHLLRHIGSFTRQIQSLCDTKYKNLNLQKGQFMFLMRICEHPSISQQDLSDLICVDKSTTTRAIQKLERDGYIKRERNPDDSRKLAVLPTQRGLAIYPELIRFELYLLRMLHKEVSKEELSMLTAVLSRFTELTNTNMAIHEQALSQLEIKLATSENILGECHAIRTEVFQKGQGVARKIDFDGRDDLASNYIAYFNHVPAGTVRLRSVSDTTVKLERLAVLSSFRNLSIASALIEYCTISARQQHYKTIKLHAQKDALTLYIKAGFQIVGEEFYEANIAHIKVEKAL